MNDPREMNENRINLKEHEIKPNVPYRAPGEPEPVKPGKSKPKNLTQTELEERRKSILASMDYDTNLAKQEETPETQKTDEAIEAERVAAEAKAAEDAAAAEQARKDEEARQAEVSAAAAGNPTTEEREAALVERTVKATTAAMKELLPPKDAKTDPAAPAVSALSAEDQADLEAVEYLERNKRVPEGMKAQMLAFYHACEAYRKQWEKDHPGEEYNPEDDEHAKKRSDMQPAIDLSLLDGARDEIRVEKMVEKRVKPLEEARQAEHRAREVGEALEKAKPAIHTAFRASIVKMIDQVAPAVLDILKDDKGRLDLSPEAIAKLESADPVAKQVLDEVIGQQLHPVVVELEKAAVLGDKWNWDMRNPLHTHIIDEILECEKILADAPANVRIQNGKQFCTAVDYDNRRREILSGTGTQAQKQAELSRLERTTWTLTTEAIKDSFIDKAAQVAKKRIENADALVKKASGKEAPSRAKAAQAATTPARTTATTPAPAKGKHVGPTITSQNDKLVAPGQGQPKAPTVGETAVALHFR